MKKRILAMVCVATLVLGMTLSVSAATSPDAGNTSGSTSPGAGDVAGSTSPGAGDVADSTTGGESDDSEAAAQDEYNWEMSQTITIPNSSGQSFDGWTILGFAETTKISSGVSGATISAVSLDTAKAMIAEANKRVSGAFIASIVDLSVPAGTGTATFTLTCPNVWKGQNVTILHQKSDGTYETIKPSNVADNSVTFTMTSYSPIAIVIDTTSPKTGDAGILSWLLSLL